MTLPDPFVLRAGLAGIGVALAAAPLGCFVVWRRMAYFGDATAHASLLGVALALAVDLPVFAGVALVALAMGAAVAALETERRAADTTLGVLSHAALAFGLVAVSLMDGVRLDLQAYLLGDILSVGTTDLGVIWGGAVLVCGLVAWRWRALLTTTFGPDMAVAAGISPARERMVLTLALAITVAVAIKVVGALLISALLIIPAAAARPLSRSPEGMAAVAIAIGIGAAAGGVALSFATDLPTGPAIVCVAATAFAVLTGAGRVLKR